MPRNIIILCTTLAITIAIGCGSILPPQATPTPEHPFWHIKRLAKRATFEELYRHNERYQGYQVYLEGQVVQIVDGDSDRYELIVAIRDTTKDRNTPARYEDPVWVHCNGPAGLLEDDIVEIVGEVKGLHTYETVDGISKTVPEITNARAQLMN